MNETPAEKRRIVESTVLVLISWAFWFAMGYAVRATMFVVNP